MKRKIVQISVVSFDRENETLVTQSLCDDGTIWQTDDCATEWYKQLPPIPQPHRKEIRYEI